MTQARALLQGRCLVAVAPAAPASAALEPGPGSREPGRFACSTRRRPRRRPEQSHTRRPAVTAMRHVPRAVRPRSRDRSPIARSGNSRVPGFVCAPCGCPCRNWTDRRAPGDPNCPPGRHTGSVRAGLPTNCPNCQAGQRDRGRGFVPVALHTGRHAGADRPGSPVPLEVTGSARWCPWWCRACRLLVAAAAELSRLSAHGNCAFRFEWMATNA